MQLTPKSKLQVSSFYALHESTCNPFKNSTFLFPLHRVAAKHWIKSSSVHKILFPFSSTLFFFLFACKNPFLLIWSYPHLWFWKAFCPITCTASKLVLWSTNGSTSDELSPFSLQHCFQEQHFSPNYQNAEYGTESGYEFLKAFVRERTTGEGNVMENKPFNDSKKSCIFAQNLQNHGGKELLVVTKGTVEYKGKHKQIRYTF